MIDTTTLAVAEDTTLLTRLSDALSVPGGTFTLDPRAGAEVRSGYTVAIDPGVERYYPSQITREDIAAYLVEQADQLAYPGVYVSGWRHGDTGVAYLYLTCVTSDHGEALSRAREGGHLVFTSLAWGRADLV
jgi:hypothetical protein